MDMQSPRPSPRPPGPKSALSQDSQESEISSSRNDSNGLLSKQWQPDRDRMGEVGAVGGGLGLAHIISCRVLPPPPLASSAVEDSEDPGPASRAGLTSAL